MDTLQTKLAFWIANKLPPKVLLYAIVRGFADASSGKWGNSIVTKLTYEDVYKRIKDKYNIKED